VDRRARVVSEHPDVDVAVLSLDAGVFGVLPLAERDALYAGAPVFAFGFPAADVLGSEGKVTDGVISALRGPEGEEHLVQTSAPIQPGSSGGPLLDDAGRVVGLVVATLRSDAFYSAVGELPQNVNWAVRADVLRRVLREAGVELPGPDGKTTGRRQAVERAAEAACYLETN
jgi:S1-C subfamily serine protease